MGLSAADAERLCEYLTAKIEADRAQVLDFDLKAVVCTVVADTLLVSEGSLSVDDFRPPDEPGS